jgi:predicted PurR-regulated permease PerM
MPALKPTPKLQRWLIRWLSLPLLVLNGWALLVLIDYFNAPLRLLIVGAVIAFLLDHPLKWLERHRVKRAPAILIIVAVTLGLLGFLGVTLVPVLTRQAQDLVGNFSNWEQSADQQTQSLHSWLQSLGIPIDLNRVTANLNSQLSDQFRATATRVPGWIEGAIGSVFELFLIIVVVVYLLLKGDSLWKGVLDWLPTKLSKSAQTTLPRSFRNYFIGQGTVALILGIVMALAFTLFRIPYGFLLGVLIGTLALFPYGGTIGIIFVTLLLSFKSIGLGLTVLAIATIVDQIVENGIAPRLMGHLTGVHPVWVVMAILIGGKIAGLLGVVLAVPIASTVKEVMETYKPKPLPPNIIPEPSGLADRLEP